MSRKHLTAVVTFPTPLAVDSAALGCTFRVTIARAAIKITLPSLGGSLDWPSLTVDLPGSDPLRPLTSREDVIWGHGFGDPSNWSWEVEGGLVGLWISRGTDPGDSPEVERFTRSFKTWFGLAQVWLWAALRSPAGPLQQSHATVLQGMHDGKYWGRGGVIESHVIAGRRGATEGELLAAFAHASAGEAIPLEHELLLDARSAVIRSQYRRAVIDAASAAELAVSQWVQRRLERHGLSANAAASISAQSSGIVELYRLAESLGMTLSTSSRRVADLIAGPRNMAVHRGTVPSNEAAARALRCTQDVLDEIAPLRLV